MITYCLTAFPLTPNTWLWLTLNPDFVLNCVLRQHVWSPEAWLSKHGWSYTFLGMCLANFDRKEHLQHRAVSLRQHGFLVFTVLYEPRDTRENIAWLISDSWFLVLCILCDYTIDHLCHAIDRTSGSKLRKSFARDYVQNSRRRHALHNNDNHRKSISGSTV